MGLNLTEIVQYTLPSLIVLIGVYFLVNRFLVEESNRLDILLHHSILKENQKISLPLRYQAYERLVLLLERIHPEQLISRNSTSRISAVQYKDRLIIDMQTEYQYNQTQQIYVSQDIWKVILQIKSQMKLLLTEVAEALPENASDQDFIMAMFQYLKETPSEKIPVNVGLKYIKNEVSQIY